MLIYYFLTVIIAKLHLLLIFWLAYLLWSFYCIKSCFVYCQLWDARKKTAVTTFQSSYQVTSVSFTDTAEQILSGGIDNEIKVCNSDIFTDIVLHILSMNWKYLTIVREIGDESHIVIGISCEKLEVQQESIFINNLGKFNLTWKKLNL